MNRNPIGLVWVAGLVLAVLLTVVGPGLLGATLGSALEHSIDAVSVALQRLGDPVREMIRGFAIAAYVVFIALCVLARRRRLPSMAVAVVVTLLSSCWRGRRGTGTCRCTARTGCLPSCYPPAPPC